MILRKTDSPLIVPPGTVKGFFTVERVVKILTALMQPYGEIYEALLDSEK